MQHGAGFTACTEGQSPVEGVGDRLYALMGQRLKAYGQISPAQQTACGKCNFNGIGQIAGGSLAHEQFANLIGVVHHGGAQRFGQRWEAPGKQAFFHVGRGIAHFADGEAVQPCKVLPLGALVEAGIIATAIGIGRGNQTEHVPVAEILHLLKQVQLPQTEFNVIEAGGSSLLGAYIEDRSGSELKEWDVALPFVTQTQQEASIPFPYATVDSGSGYCRRRGSGRRDDRLVKITEKNAVAFGVDDMAYGEERKELDHKAEEIKRKQMESGIEIHSEAIRYAMARTRPLLVIHLLNFSLASNNPPENPLAFDKAKPVVTFSLVFPGTSIPCKERRYQASQRLIQLLAERREATETDEELVDE